MNLSCTIPRQAAADISGPVIRSAFSHLFSRLNKGSCAGPSWWVTFAGPQVSPTALVWTFSKAELHAPFISPFNIITSNSAFVEKKSLQTTQRACQIAPCSTS